VAPPPIPGAAAGAGGPGECEFFFPQLSHFNSENYACANGIAKQRHVRGNSFATEDLGSY